MRLFNELRSANDDSSNKAVVTIVNSSYGQLSSKMRTQTARQVKRQLEVYLGPKELILEKHYHAIANNKREVFNLHNARVDLKNETRS